MLTIRRDNFIYDLLVWFLISVVLASTLAAGFAALTDKYFAKTIAGIMGDSGEYDLLFQTRTDQKDETLKALKQISHKHFPGATIEPGIAIAGKTTFFWTFPAKYRTKEIFSNLGFYFTDLPGGAGYSLVTEPRLTVDGVPGGVYDRMIREFEAIRGVVFAFRDGGSISVVLKSSDEAERVTRGIREVLRSYQVLEVSLPTAYRTEDTVAIGKTLAQKLTGWKGVTFIRDVSMGDRADDYQALLTTLSQMRQFLLSYASEVRLFPVKGAQLQAGDRLALAGDYKGKIRRQMVLRPEQVVIKVLSVKPDEIQGLIIQGDATQIRDLKVYELQNGDKLGRQVATAEIISRKDQLAHALDEGAVLLSKTDLLASDLGATSGRAELTIGKAAELQAQVREAQAMLNRTAQGIDKLTSEETQERLEKLAALFEDLGDDFNNLAQQFARVRLVEERVSKAADSVRGFQSLLHLGLIAYPSSGGGIGEKLDDFDGKLDRVLGDLNRRAQTLDDFVNQFNPLVRVLLSWRSKAKDFSTGVQHVSGMLEKDLPVTELLSGMTGITQETLTTLQAMDFGEIQSDLNRTTNQISSLNQIDLGAIVQQMKAVRASLPNLMDEEIGRSVSLIDQYLGGEVIPGERVKLFVNTGPDIKALQGEIREILKSPGIKVASTPSGSIELNLRGEVFKILREVRGVIASLIVLLLFILFFLLDQSSVIAVLKRDEIVAAEIAKGWTGFAARFRNGRWVGLLYSVGLSMTWLILTLSLSGARIPYVGTLPLMIIGILFGLAFYGLADRVYQLDMDEMMAGQSLGLTFPVLMREIVLPAGRPGLLQILNARRMVMRA